jgi:hypothetical protein
MSNITLVDLETKLLTMPQASCPVVHRFGPGIYIRELQMAAGTLAVGKIQKFEHVNILLKGKVIMFNDNGSTTTLEAPLFFIGKAGRKAGLVLEDMVWQNIYATEETDIDKLEAMFMEEPDAFKEHTIAKLAFDKIEVQNDIDDYNILLEEINMSEECVQRQVQITSDLIPFDTPNNLRVTSSVIHGKGLFTTIPISQGTRIAKASIAGHRTPAGRYTNHSAVPNCTLVRDGLDIWLEAIEDIDGCLGGSVGQELTVDYRVAIKLNPTIIGK